MSKCGSFYLAAGVAIGFLALVRIQSGLPAAQSQVGVATHAAAADAARMRQLGRERIHFEESPDAVFAGSRYVARGRGYVLALAPDAAVLQFAQKDHAAQLHLQLEGADPAARGSAQDRLPGVTNYYVGSRVAENVANYGRVRFDGVYPGVDVVYYGTGDLKLEHDFIVAPGADPARIRYVIQGADSAALNAQGDLVLGSVAGDVLQHKPVAYQQIGGQRREVDAHFTLKRGAKSVEVSFALGDYDRAQPLVIDPVISFETFLGGSDAEDMPEIVVDAAGYATVVCLTGSTDVPTLNAFQPGHAGNSGVGDLFIVRYSPTGDRQYATYFGGAGSDIPVDVLLDQGGNLIVHGFTSSTDLPVSPGAFQTVHSGLFIDFLAKFSTAGTRVFATYYGGHNLAGPSSANVSFDAMRLDPAGNIYLAGNTVAVNLPVHNAWQPNPGLPSVNSDGVNDVYLAKFTPSGTNVYSTYVGGSDIEYGPELEVDASGDAYLALMTKSNDILTQTHSAPAQYTPAQATPLTPSTGDSSRPHQVTQTVFLAKFNPTGTPIFASYLPTTILAPDISPASGYTDLVDLEILPSGGMAVAGNEQVYAGATCIGPSGSRVTGGVSYSYQVFLDTLDATGALGLERCIGGDDGQDYAYDVAVDSGGAIALLGLTNSSTGIATDGTLLNLGAISSRLDLFLYHVQPSLGGSTWATYIGGSGDDAVDLGSSQIYLNRTHDYNSGLLLDTHGNIWVVGETDSEDFDDGTGTNDLGGDPMGGNRAVFISRFLSDGTRTVNTALPFVTLTDPDQGHADYIMSKLDQFDDIYLELVTDTELANDFFFVPGPPYPGQTPPYGAGGSTSRTVTVIGLSAQNPIPLMGAYLGFGGQDTFHLTDDASQGYHLAIDSSANPATFTSAGVYVACLSNSTMGSVDFAPSAQPFNAGGFEDLLIARYGPASNTGAGSVQFTGTTFSVNEGGGFAIVSVSRIDGASGPVSVDVSTGAGSAAAGSDYTAVATTLSWADGEGGIKTFQVPIIQDTKVESTESVPLTLSNPLGGAVIGAPGTATLSIIDDDSNPTIKPGSIQFTQNNYVVSEAGAFASIQVQRVGGTDGAVGVSFTTSNGTATAGADYTSVSSTISFADGEAGPKTVTVPIINDTVVEPNETVNLQLSAPSGGATLGSPSSATLTIIDDDSTQAGVIQLASGSFSVSENAGPAVITLLRTGGAGGAVSVVLTTTNGTAVAGSDYTAGPYTVSWASGDTAPKTVGIAIVNDSIFEGNETFQVQLGAPSGGALLGNPSSAIVTILDDESPQPGSLQLSSAAYSVGEGDGIASIVVTRTGGVDGSVSATLTAGGGTATPGVDFAPVTTTVVFGPGDAAPKTVNIPITQDAEFEPNETVSLVLSNPSGGAVLGAPNAGVLTILDDDSPQRGSLQLSAASYEISESGGAVLVNITRTGGADGAVSVQFSTADITAAAGSDYTAVTQTVNFADGETSKNVSIPIVDDQVAEKTETFGIALSNPGNGAALGAPSAGVVVIRDDDAQSISVHTDGGALDAGLLAMLSLLGLGGARTRRRRHADAH